MKPMRTYRLYSFWRMCSKPWVICFSEGGGTYLWRIRVYRNWYALICIIIFNIKVLVVISYLLPLYTVEPGSPLISLIGAHWVQLKSDESWLAKSRHVTELNRDVPLYPPITYKRWWCATVARYLLPCSSSCRKVTFIIIHNWAWNEANSEVRSIDDFFINDYSFVVVDANSVV